MSPIVTILVTCPTIDVARQLVEHLVRHNLVACGSLIPGVESIYQWNQVLEHAQEVQILLKTTHDRVPEAMAQITELHPYEVPEILVLPVIDGSASYLDWIRTSTQSA